MDDNRAENGDGRECHYCLNRPRVPSADAPSEKLGVLTRAILTKEQMEPLLQLSRDQLYEIGGWLRDAADGRIERQLLQTLLAMCARCLAPVGSKPASVEFVTNTNYPEGISTDGTPARC